MDDVEDVDDLAEREAAADAYDQEQIAERQRIIQERIDYHKQEDVTRRVCGFFTDPLPATVKEREVQIMKSPREALKKAIRSKPRWEEKVSDESISKRYKTEAEEQGVATDVVDSVLKQLREEASYILLGKSAGSDTSSSTSSGKPVVSDTSLQVDFEELKKEVSAVQTKLAANEGDLIADPLDEQGNGVWVVDKIVPKKLRDLLENTLDAIANQPKKDFHPGTDDQVQDLIHPSLFPYIEKVSHITCPADELPKKNEMNYWSRQYEDSTYQWLPAEFYVDENGGVKIESYINNLDEEKHKDLYRGIELLFEIFVPIFEKLQFEVEELDLHDRQLQVIVKAANYVIQPKGQVYEGSWHVEGMSHEHIVATGIYYYSTSPFLKDGGLEFRRERNEEEDYPQVDQFDWSMQERMGEDFPNMEGLNMTIHLGAVPTVEDRLLVFPNGLQHKVSGVLNESEDQVGIRKILVFFLVDPDREIISTKHVRPQQWERYVPGLVNTMSLVVKRVSGRSFPLPIIQEIVSRAQTGLTMEEARRHRLELMRERKYKIDHDNEEWEREYSLCEH